MCFRTKELHIVGIEVESGSDWLLATSKRAGIVEDATKRRQVKRER